MTDDKPDNPAATPQVRPPAPVRPVPVPPPAKVPWVSPPLPADGIELAPGVKVPESAVRVAFSRSSGPGGQNVNKVNSKAEVWVRLDAIVGMHPEAIERLRALGGRRVTDAGELHLVAEASRSQQQNREEALLRVRQLVLQALIRPKARRKTKVSRAAKRRRVDSKRRRGEVKSNRRAGGHGD
ncbi:MAG: Class peptide chain release factor [Phycisphaerales bacterium]|nr:Class peptide chain release factor [Phycisphaerales bacterium]